MKFFQPIDFTLKWYAIDSFNFKDANAIPAVISQLPFKTASVNQLNYAWWNGIKEGDRLYSKFLTIAEGQAEMERGNYELSVSWDDAVKIYVDGKLIFKEWDPSKYIFDESPNKKAIIYLSKGIHHFRVEHVELGNFATLSLKVQKLDP
jgi:PA14 domain